MEYKQYTLDFGWKVVIPADWIFEFDKDSEQFTAYPDNSGLTMWIKLFHAEKNGVPADVGVWEDVLSKVFPAEAEPVNMGECEIDGYICEAMKWETVEDSTKLFVLCAMIYGSEGDMLKVDVYGSDRKEVEDCGFFINLFSKAAQTKG